MGQSLGEALSAILDDQPHTRKKAATPEVASASGVTADVLAIAKGVPGFDASAFDGEGNTQLPLDAPLRELGLDRLGVVELAIKCENHTKVRIDDDTIPTFKTLRDIIDYLESQHQES